MARSDQRPAPRPAPRPARKQSQKSRATKAAEQQTATIDVIETEDDLIAALMEASHKARTDSDKYRTVEELAFSLNRSVDWVRRRLRVLKDNGRIEVGRVTRPNIADIMCPRVAYCVKTPLAT